MLLPDCKQDQRNQTVSHQPSIISTGYQYLTELILKWKLFINKALNGLAPSYISELFTFYTPYRTLWPWSNRLLCVPRVKHKYGAIQQGPKLWNTLTKNFHRSRALIIFLIYLLLKTHHLFKLFNTFILLNPPFLYVCFLLSLFCIILFSFIFTVMFYCLFYVFLLSHFYIFFLSHFYLKLIL